MPNPANTRFLYISAGVFLFLIIALLTHHRDSVAKHVTAPFKSSNEGETDPTPAIPSIPEIPEQELDAKPTGKQFAQPKYETSPVEKDPSHEKVAIATWYSSTVADKENDDYTDDVYFTATRMLAYQLLHDPETRSRKNIPFIVLCTPDVSDKRRERLTKDGAIVHPVDWLVPENNWFEGAAQRETWHDIMSKLHVYELTEYSKILLMDGDSLLQSPIDGIFDDPAAQIRKTNPDKSLRKSDEKPLPSQYLLASVGEPKNDKHSYPLKPEELMWPNGFCAGFFMLGPDLEMFEHLKSVLEIKDRFDPIYMEQNLLNYVHRLDGPMPWTRLSQTWSTRDLNYNDMQKGIVSAHMKYWEWPMSNDQKVMDWFSEVHFRMVGYYQAYDEWRKDFPSYRPGNPISRLFRY